MSNHDNTNAAPPRTRPEDLLAEAAILASCMRSSDALDYALGVMKPTDWASDRSTSVWRAICEVSEAGRRPNVIAVASQLRRAGLLDHVGGTDGLDRLDAIAPDTTNIAAYVSAVRGCAKRRAVLAEAERLAAEACGDFGERDVDAWASAAAEAVARVADESSEDTLLTGVDVAGQLFDKWQNPDNGDVPMLSGIGDLDRLMRGMRGGQLIVVGAHSGVGKSAFAMNVGANVLVNQRRDGLPSGVLVFSLEMSGIELAERVGCSLAWVDSRKLDPDFRGEFTADEGRALIGAIEHIRTERWHIDDRCDLTMAQIRAKARRVAGVLRRQGTPLRLVIIDYAQIVSPEARRRDQNREQEVASVGRAAKKLAKELMVPVILCAQLNQDAHKEGRKPRGADMRESRGLLQDADKVLLLWNPAALRRTESLANGERVRLDPDDFDVAEIILDKHRGGRPGTVRVRYWPAYTMFAEAKAEDLDVDLGGAPKRKTGAR